MLQLALDNKEIDTAITIIERAGVSSSAVANDSPYILFYAFALLFSKKTRGKEWQREKKGGFLLSALYDCKTMQWEITDAGEVIHNLYTRDDWYGVNLELCYKILALLFL